MVTRQFIRLPVKSFRLGGVHVFPGKISISLFVLRTQRAVQILDMLALANSVCLRFCALVSTYLLCEGMIAPCCAVFTVYCDT